MATSNTGMFGTTPDYGLSQEIIALLGLSSTGHVGGESTYTEEVKHSTPQSYTVNSAGASAGKPTSISTTTYNENPSLYAMHYNANYYSDVTKTSHDYGMFDPTNEGMIGTALAKKFGLTGEEQRDVFKAGLFQPISQSMIDMLNPSQYRAELGPDKSPDPVVSSTMSGMNMAGSGMAQKRAMEARQALRKQRAGGIAKMSGNIMGQRDSILTQVQKWHDDARNLALDAGVGNVSTEDET